jgi:hypothetical protein
MIGLFYPDRAHELPTGTSGGSWLAAAPLSLVTSADITDVARSTDVLTTSTVIQIDLGATYPLRLFYMAGTNLSDTATWVVKVGTTSGAGDVLTTGSLNAWELGSETGFAAVGVQDTAAYAKRRFHNAYIHTSFVFGRYLRYEITDTSNPAGYIDVGKAGAAGGYIPTINASYGLKDSWTDLSTKTRAESGAQWVNKRRRVRSVSMVLEQRTLIEADLLHDMQRILGTVEPVFYSPDIADAQLTQRYGFLGTMRELSSLEYPYYNRRSLPVSIEEIA